MAINKKSFLGTIKKGVHKGISGAGSYIAQQSGMMTKAKKGGIMADIKAVNMFMGKIPSGIPDKVRANAKTALQKLVKAGNYKGARDYIKGITEHSLKPMVKKTYKTIKK